MTSRFGKSSGSSRDATHEGDFKFRAQLSTSRRALRLEPALSGKAGAVGLLRKGKRRRREPQFPSALLRRSTARGRAIREEQIDESRNWREFSGRGWNLSGGAATIQNRRGVQGTGTIGDTELSSAARDLPRVMLYLPFVKVDRCMSRRDYAGRRNTRRISPLRKKAANAPAKRRKFPLRRANLG